MKYVDNGGSVKFYWFGFSCLNNLGLWVKR